MQILEKIKSLFVKDAGTKRPGPVNDVKLGVLIALIAAILSVSGPLEKYELSLLDEMFKIRGVEKPSDKIVIIEIEDKSLEILGRWPWPRSHHASLVDILNEAKPRSMAFDVLFPEADIENDATFAAVIQKSANIYLAAYFSLEKSAKIDIPDKNPGFRRMASVARSLNNSNSFLRASSVTLPVGTLAGAARSLSIVNVPQDPDGITRRLPLFIEFGGALYPALSLELACDYLGVDIKGIKIESGAVILPLQNDPVRIPIDSKGQLILNYSGPISTFERYSYLQVIQDYTRAVNGEDAKILNNLRGKIILVGHTATGTIDSRITPFSSAYPAVGVHATALSNILNRNFISRASLAVNIFTVLFLGAILGVLLRRGRRAVTNLAIMSAIFVIYFLLDFASFSYFDFWLNTFAPLAVILLTYVGITINQYSAIRYEKKILENELLIARAIQQSFLPKSFPEVPFLHFAAKCLPAKHIGGDLYDFVTLEGGKIGIAIGDVSGKGVPAALYMARGISQFRTVAHLNRDPAYTLKTLNDAVSKEGMEKSFITMQYITVDLGSRQFVFSNGGHNTVLHLIKKGGTIEEIDTKAGMPIGVMEGIDFENKEIKVDKGDLLVLYTDGVSEAMDIKRKEFGIDRVKEILLANCGSDAGEIMQKVLEGIARFVKNAPQHDDMTVIVIKAI